MFSTRLKLSVFLSLSSVLVGCAPNPNPTPTGAIDFQGFSDLEVQEIQADLAQLGTIQNHDVSFIAQSNLGGTSGYTIIGESEVGVPHCHILLDPNDFSGTPEQPSLIQQSVVWHEYGHCAGLYHDPDDDAVMFWLVSDFASYSNDELAKYIGEVRQLGGIK